MADGTDLKTNGSSKGTYTPDGFAAGSTLRPKGSPGDAKELIETKRQRPQRINEIRPRESGEATKAGMQFTGAATTSGKNSDEEDLVLDILALRCSVKAKRIQVLLQGIRVSYGTSAKSENLERFKKGVAGNGN